MYGTVAILHLRTAVSSRF